MFHTGLDRIVDLNGIVQRRRDQVLPNHGFEVAFLLHIAENLRAAFFDKIVIDRALFENGHELPQFIF